MLGRRFVPLEVTTLSQAAARIRRMRFLPAAAVAFWLLGQGLASAQADPPPDVPATRAGTLEAQRAARQQSIGPEPRHWLERTLILRRGEARARAAQSAEGFYPNLGSLTTGSGFGVGAGGRVLIDTSAAWTYKDYRTAQAHVAVQPKAGRPIELRAGTLWYDFTQEDFFGLGRACAATVWTEQRRTPSTNSSAAVCWTGTRCSIMRQRPSRAAFRVGPRVITRQEVHRRAAHRLAPASQAPADALRQYTDAACQAPCETQLSRY